MEYIIYPLNTLASYTFVVVLSIYDGKIMLSRHKNRTTWETQGGHIEKGETPLEAAKRELYEESGAVRYRINPAFDYWYSDEPGEAGANGMVFVTYVDEINDLPDSEMAEISFFDRLPDDLTYPDITPVLFRKAGINTTYTLEPKCFTDIHNSHITCVYMDGRENADAEGYMVYKDSQPCLRVVVPATWNPFDTVIIWRRWVCAGFGETVAWIEIESGETRRMQLDSYFGYFYEHAGRLYIASGMSLYCIDSQEGLVWISEALAVDGVIVEEFLDETAKLSCEMDPPGGWRERRVRLADGAEV